MDNITCTLCEQAILRTETCARTKCCRYYVHYDCYIQALDNQMNKGVIKEKLYCQMSLVVYAKCARAHLGQLTMELRLVTPPIEIYLRLDLRFCFVVFCGYNLGRHLCHALFITFFS